jgi:hypothetical protein
VIDRRPGWIEMTHPGWLERSTRRDADGGVDMPKVNYDSEEVARRGEEIYERDIRSKVESVHKGKFLVIDIETGDYEIDSRAIEATHRIMARHPDGERFLIRIGFPVAHQVPTPGVILK